MSVLSPLVVVPARLNSSRLPGKPLLAAGGIPLVVHTARQAALTGFRTAVATDSEEVVQACEAHGVAAHLVPDELATQPGGKAPPAPIRNGSQRAFALARLLDHKGAIVNWQLDWPNVDPADVRNASLASVSFGGAAIVTLARPFGPEGLQALNFHNAKVLTDHIDRASYFTRAAVPLALHHIGIYCFSPASAAVIPWLNEAPAAKAEHLEQLDWLFAGFPVHVRRVADPVRRLWSIDTGGDYSAWRWSVEHELPKPQGVSEDSGAHEVSGAAEVSGGSPPEVLAKSS